MTTTKALVATRLEEMEAVALLTTITARSGARQAITQTAAPSPSSRSTGRAHSGGEDVAIQIEQRKKDGMLQEPVHDGQTLSAMKVLCRCLLNTIRLATGPAEVAGVLRFFFRRLTGSSNAKRDETLRLQGVTHVLGLGTGELLFPQGMYWERVYDRLPDFVPQPGWIVFDVGASTGVYAVQQARRGAHVYAFEPNPDCYRRLRKSVRANNLESRVMAVNYALGATAGSAELHVPNGMTIGGRTPGAGGIGLRVEVETIDRVVSTLGINRIDLLKVNVEGLELDVLQGAHETFALVDRLVMEYHSLDLCRRVVELLAEHGLTTLYEKTYHGHGILFATRQAGSAPPPSDLDPCASILWLLAASPTTF